MRRGALVALSVVLINACSAEGQAWELEASPTAGDIEHCARAEGVTDRDAVYGLGGGLFSDLRPPDLRLRLASEEVAESVERCVEDAGGTVMSVRRINS